VPWRSLALLSYLVCVGLRRLLFVSESIFKSTLEMMNDSAAIFGIAKYTHNMVERPFWCLNLRYPGFKEASVDFKYDVAV
jgi:hypothetical protein